MESNEFLGTLKGGLGLAGRLAGKGLGEVSGLLRGRDEGSSGTSGLYWRRPGSEAPAGLRPRLELFEPQEGGRFSSGVMTALTVSRAERAYMQACGELVAGRLEGAAERLGEAVSRDAQLTDGYFLLGCVRLDQGLAGEAARNFQKALLCQQGLGARARRYLPSLRMVLPLTRFSAFVLLPDLLGLNLLLALSQHGAGRGEDAALTLEQLLGVMPGEPTALFFRSLFHLEQREFRRVVEDLKAVLPDSNLLVANLLLLGKGCEGLGDPVTARDLYRKALGRSDLDPGLRRDLRHALGEALIAEGWPAEGRRELDEVLAEEPGYLPLWTRLGLLARAPAGPLGLAPEAPVAPPAASPAAPAPEPPSAPAPPPAGPAAPASTPTEASLSPEEPLLREASPAPPPPPPAPLPPVRPGETRLVSEDGRVDLLLQDQPVVIGREEGDVLLGQDTSVSRAHARITWEGGCFQVEDLGSTNGTWVNRHRLTRRVELHRGDLLQIGQTLMKLQ